MSEKPATNRDEIIVKKVKKGGHGGHHGGAWKVAYADFVTAMMAFFLLLWLLGATTEDQRKGIADYFAPAPPSLSSGGSGGMLGGLSFAPGARRSASSAATVVVALRAPDADAKAPGQAGGQGESKAGSSALEKLRAEEEQEAFEQAQAALLQAIEESPELHELSDNILVDMTPEGMRIQIVDRSGGSMFASGSAKMPGRTQQLIKQIAKAISKLPNKISISGRDALPDPKRVRQLTPFQTQSGYGNWELSSDRANASRRALVAGGITPNRIIRVTGKADTDPLVPEDPFVAQNRRISVVLIREAPVLPPSLQKK